MNDVLFIKAYVNLNDKEFDELAQDELYDGFRGIWRIAKDKTQDLKYAFGIHNGIIKCVYQINQWHGGNTTRYKARTINNHDPKIKNRLEFTGQIALNMHEFIGKNVSRYYQRGEANPIKYMNLDELSRDLFDKIVYPDEIEENDLFEGSKKQILVNAYERNSQARIECIKHYGTKCSICSFDFEKIYGEIGKDFIHVHHIKPLSEINEQYKINPIEDLRPVCPNCHAMLHKRKPAYKIEEIQNKITENIKKI